MTTVAEIVQDAYRETDIISINATPTSLELAEGLRLLNRVRLAVYGNEAGEQLQAYPIGRNNVLAPADFPETEGSIPSDWTAPSNTLFRFNLSSPFTLRLDPNPNDGARLAVVDASNNFATNPLTIVGNGNRINGTTSQILNTNGAKLELFYDERTATWTTVPATFVSSDTWPFPEEFDSMFVIALAMRLNPRHSMTMDPQSLEEYKTSRRNFRARYTQITPIRSELGLIRRARTGARYATDGIGDNTANFNVGRPFQW